MSDNKEYPIQKSVEVREYEYRFANINTTLMRKKLKKLEFVIVNPKRIMPLISFTHPTNKKTAISE